MSARSSRRAENRSASTQERARHRAARPHSREPYGWLGAGAVTLGVGAALIVGAGQAGADTGTDDASSSSSAASSTSSSPSGRDKAENDSTDSRRAPNDDRDVNKTRTGKEMSPADDDDTHEPDAQSADDEAVGAAPDGPGISVDDDATVAISLNAPLAEEEADTPAPRGGSVAPALLGLPLAPVREDRRSDAAAESAAISGDLMSATGLAEAAVNVAPTVTVRSVGSPGWFTGNVRGRVRATDSDGGKLTYIGGSTNSGTVTVSSWGSFTYRPTATARHAAAAPNGPNADTFTITVVDGQGGSTTTYVTVPIRSANSRPNARASVGKPNPANGVVTGKLTTADRDGDAIGYAGTGTTPRGNVVINADGTFVYRPTDDALSAAGSFLRRTDRFKVVVTDGHGGTDAVTVTVRIPRPGSNRAPKAGSPAFTVTGVAAGNGQVTGYVTATDPDGFTVTYALNTTVAPNIGTVSVATATGAFAFTPTTAAREAAHGTPGEDTAQFSVVATDGAASEVIVVTVPISAKAPAPPPPPPPPATRMRWPLANVSVNRYFGGSGHNGIDLRATNGTPVYAAADGVVSFEGYGENHSWMTRPAGISILIWHPSLNVYTGYAHLSRTIINNGQTISRGQLIGYSGYTGNVIPAGPNGAHLHFEVLPKNPNFGNGYSGRIDPLPYLR